MAVDPEKNEMVPAESAPSLRVIAYPALCKGWGQCNRWGGAVFPFDAEGHVDFERLEVDAESADDALWGVDACPEHALAVIGPEREFWLQRRRQLGAEAAARRSSALSK